MRFVPRLAPAALCIALLAALPTLAEAKAPKKLYVSVGDSLSRGVLSNAKGQNVLSRVGYPRQLAKSTGTKLVELGCAGATTKTFIVGGKCVFPSHKTSYKNNSRKTSQLATAAKFIKKNRKRIAFVTIDIGANDVASCADGGKVDLPCVNRGVAAIKKNGPKIAKTLRKAGGNGMAMAVTTLYDPFLQQWFNGSTGVAIAQASVDIAKKQVNPAITGAFKTGKFKVAKTDVAFGTYLPFSQTTTFAGRTGVPVAVANICKLTHMCKPPPQGPDIHATKAGYGVMAGAYRKALGRAAK